MPRVRVTKAELHEQQAAIAADHLAEQVGEAKPRKLTNPLTKQVFERAELMRTSQDWKGAEPKHLVALFVWCHEQVYGVRPDEILKGEQGRKHALGAVSAARALLQHEFAGQVRGVVAFVLWVWRRERDREEWAARTPGAHRGRVTALKQFSAGTALTEFKLEHERKRHARQST